MVAHYAHASRVLQVLTCIPVRRAVTGVTADADPAIPSLIGIADAPDAVCLMPP
jgi:hypothetical protein